MRPWRLGSWFIISCFNNIAEGGDRYDPAAGEHLRDSMSEAGRINWVYFPKSSRPPEFGLLIVALFEELAEAIDSRARAGQPSDIVMARLRPGLEKLGFRVEKGKSAEDKIVVPVLFGRRGKIVKCFNADAHAPSKGWVLEVEAARAVDNNQFLKVSSRPA